MREVKLTIQVDLTNRELLRKAVKDTLDLIDITKIETARAVPDDKFDDLLMPLIPAGQITITITGMETATAAAARKEIRAARPEPK